MPLNKDNDIFDEIEILFRDILINYSDVLPNKKKYEIEIDKSKSLIDNREYLKKQILRNKNMLSNDFNKMVPFKYKKDFEIIFDGDEPKWVAKTEDAYKKFPLKFQFTINPDNPSYEKVFNFRKLLNEANMGKGWVEFGTVDELKQYLGDDEHPLPPIDVNNLSNIKWYIGKETNPEEIQINLKVYNKNHSYIKNNIKLQLLSIDYEHMEFIYSNKWLDDWYNANIIFKKENLESDMMTVTFNYGIRNEYINDLKYYKEIYQYLYLLNDKNAKVSVIEKEHNVELLNTCDFGKYDFNEKDDEIQSSSIELMNWLLSLEEINNCKLNFDIGVFLKKKNALLILYNAYNNKDTTLDNDLLITLPNKHITYLKENMPYLFGAKFNSIEIFDQHLEINITKMLNTVGYIKEINEKNIKVICKVIVLADSLDEMMNNQIYVQNIDMETFNKCK